MTDVQPKLIAGRCVANRVIIWEFCITPRKGIFQGSHGLGYEEEVSLR
jgi:hypothetical protein